jgi:thiol-disulfide isomerase/thioredoxin
MSKAEKRKIRVPRGSSPEREIENKDNVFVLFYATWCPFSQRFLPVFEEYARDNPQNCMSVIVDERPDLCEEYAIEYYPTVVLFKNGKVHRRLDAEPGVGLTKRQLTELTKNP